MAIISKIFVCSTAYDLIDMRAEVCEFIKRLGYDVLAFEDPKFLTYIDKSRHDMCLEEVDKADALIAIIDQRAGAPYTGNRFVGDNITVTMAETRCALERGIPVVVFVRDKTSTERNIYNDSKKKGIKPPTTKWVNPKDAEKVFSFLDDIQMSEAGIRHEFRHSVELRQLLGGWLDKISGRASHSLIGQYNAALVPAVHIDNLVERLYSVHRGDIWLFNNDLELLKSEHLFQKVYIKTLRPKLIDGTISSVRILLRLEKYLEFFDPNKNSSRKKLLDNFSQFGKEIEKIYIARMDSLGVDTNIGLHDQNLIFYTVDSDITSPDTVCIIRHHSRPFTADKSGEARGEDLVTICRCYDHPVFFDRCKNAIEKYFTDTNNFGQLCLEKGKKDFGLKQIKP